MDDAWEGVSRNGVRMVKRIRDYRDLVAWQQAIELALECRAVARKLPRSEWELASQLRRASTSVHLNIAEGNGRPTLIDYVKYLGNARSSLNEVDSSLRFIARLFPAMREVGAALARVVCVAKPLAGLKKSLERKLQDEQ
jgi:four helix bundle protein